MSDIQIMQLHFYKELFIDFCVSCRRSCGNNYKLAAKIIRDYGKKMARQLHRRYRINFHLAYESLMN